MFQGKSSRSGSSRSLPGSGRDGRAQELPSRPFSLPPGYYELYGIRPPEPAPGRVQMKRSGLGPIPSGPPGLLEYYGIVSPTTPDRAQGAALSESKAVLESAPLATPAMPPVAPGAPSEMTGQAPAPVEDRFARAAAGAMGELPFRGEMERGFGTSFADVRAHLGGEQAVSGLRSLGGRGGYEGIDRCVRLAVAIARVGRARIGPRGAESQRRGCQ